MSQTSGAVLRLRVEPTNPGQFFACCGLLELADRLWGGAVGWFDQEGTYFMMRNTTNADSGLAKLVKTVAGCPMANSMTESQTNRRKQLSAMNTKSRESDPELEAEKKELDSLYREAPVVLSEPFHLRVDWFLDVHSGGKELKTWAGQQSVIDIAHGMKNSIDGSPSVPEDCLVQAVGSDYLPFNFDSDLGGVGSALDVGFSFDPLKGMVPRIKTRPLIEFAAFVGLQRFRPCRIDSGNAYEFSTWTQPLLPEVASATACGVVGCLRSSTFRFRLLYRTKYLKSFLPASRV